MKSSVMLSFLLLLLLPDFASAEQMCIVPKQVIKGVRLHSSPKDLVDFYPGEDLVLVSINEKKKHTLVSLGNSKYVIPSQNLVRTRKAFCGIKMCVKLKNKQSYYKSPNEFDQAAPIADGIYPVLTKSEGWYRVQANKNFIWIRGEQLKSSKVACNAPMTTEVSEDVATTSAMAQPSEIEEEVVAAKRLSAYQWHYGFEGGWIQSVSSKPIKNLLSTLPAGNTDVNNDSFDSPFIERVDDGTGWYAGVTLEAFLWWNLKAKWSLGYKSRSIDYIARPNPHAATPVTYDQLGRDDITQNFGFVYLGTVIKHEGWKVGPLLFQPGLNLGIDFALDQFSVDFDTKPNKLTLISRDSGYKTIEPFYGPRLDISYGVLVFSAMANFTSYAMEPTLGLGMQF